MKPADRSRSSHLTPGQIEYEFGIAIPGPILPDTQWARTAIKRLPDAGEIEWADMFQRAAPLCLDIGCGNGRFTLASAIERSDWNHVAIDSLPAVIRYATRRANQRGLINTRFAVVDGWRLLHDYSRDQTWNEIHIYHPQPYADPRKASRRMLTPDFLLLLHRKLKEHGAIYLQTDRKSYWNYIQSAMSLVFDWQTIEGGWPDGPEFRSRREILALKQGLRIFRGIARRRSGWTEQDLEATILRLPQPSFKVD